MNKFKQPQNYAQSSQSGFSIIEVLLAIIVVSILMAAIAPAIVLSVATRMQAKRIELGTTAAKSYIDGVRSGAIKPPLITNAHTIANDVEVPTGGGFTCSAPAGVTPAPKAFYCTDPPSNLYCIDNDNTGNCETTSFQDMVVQGFGLSPEGAVGPTEEENEKTAKKGYLLGIRVYRADAFADSSDLKKSDQDANRAASTFTGGQGDRKAPLIEMTTEIFTPDTKYSDLCNRLDPINGCSSPPPP
jgi:prepilin-type N-terminal cleavage/methylation domain-containing protein